MAPDVDKPRVKTVTMSEFRNQPGEYLLDVRRDRQTLLLTKAGKPVALVLPIADSAASEGDARELRALLTRVREFAASQDRSVAEYEALAALRELLGVPHV